MALCAKNTAINIGGMNGYVHWTLLFTYFYHFMVRWKGEMSQYLETRHMCEKSWTQHPVAMTLVPFWELQCHQDTVVGHTTLFLKWIYYEQQHLWVWNCQNSYFALENRLLSKRPWGLLASPSPWLEAKILRVMKSIKKDWTEINNSVKKISEGGLWWVEYLINICSHFC